MVKGSQQETITSSPEVTGLPLPGYKGAHVGLPAPGLLQGCWMPHRPDVVYVATEGPLETVHDVAGAYFER